MRMLATIGVLCVALLGLWAQPSWGAEAFARITDAKGTLIAGDQTEINGVAGSANAITVLSTTFGLSNPPAEPGGIVPGKPSVTPVGFVKRFDPASPKLLRAAFLGESLTVEIIWYMEVGGQVRRTTSVRLEGAYIVGISAGADLRGGNAVQAVEQVSLTYSRITFTVPTVSANGQLGTPVSVCIDLVQNKIC